MSKQGTLPQPPYKISNGEFCDGAGRGVSAFPEEDTAVLRPFLVKCANSYTAHFTDPLDAAEHDLLGEALFLLQGLLNSCKKFYDDRPFGPTQIQEAVERADALLAKVKK